MHCPAACFPSTTGFGFFVVSVSSSSRNVAISRFAFGVVIARSESDEAIHRSSYADAWIASAFAKASAETSLRSQ
jgi:hypothetical protein